MIGRALLALTLAAPAWVQAGPAPAQATEDGTRLEAELSLGHESSSSPLVRVSPDGALVPVPGLSRLAGQVRRLAANAATDGALAGTLRWAATGVVETRQSPDAPGLAFGLGLVDLALRWPLLGGTVGVGPSWQNLSVAGQAFRRTAATHLDWTQAAADGTAQSWRLDLARQHHADAYADLDADVIAPAGNRQWAQPGLGLSRLDIGWGLRVERNRRGLPELSNRSVHIMGEATWEARGLSWAVSVMAQRTRFGASPTPDEPARRDRFVAVDASVEWPLGDHLALRASVGVARNQARPWLYDNRHRHADLALSGHW